LNLGELRLLLQNSESALLQGQREISNALALVRQALIVIDNESSSAVAPSMIETVFDSHREELVDMVVAALESDTARATAAARLGHILSFDRKDECYRIGRRRIALANMEQKVLDIMWAAIPAPVSREDIYAKLYVEDARTNIGIVDVFMSKLRQKLKSASGGEPFIQSIRGKGWSLNPELCRLADQRDVADEQSEGGRTSSDRRLSR
jgi:DNA-binding winged helix-turn-helix (wHTH) protein